MKSTRQRIAERLEALGYRVNSLDDFRIIKGPKAKSDILECWSVTAAGPAGRDVEIVSGHTMTALVKGLVLKPNTPHTCLYGDLIAEPI